jgi:hypothetical protein
MATGCRRLRGPGTRRQLADPRQADHGNVEAEELTAKLQGGRSDLLAVAAGPGSDVNAQRQLTLFHRLHPVPARLKSVTLRLGL